MRVDLHLSGDRLAVADMIQIAREADEAGLGAVWVGEGFHDSFVPLTAIACNTSRIRLGTNVAQWTRTLPNLELAAADLQETSGGRFTLGLGTMPREWNELWHGISYDRPLRRMREYVEALRLLWTAGPDRPVSYHGDEFRVEEYVRFHGPLEPPVPIHLGVTRVGMAKLAGELADGANFNVALTPAYLDDVLIPAVHAGARKAGREHSELALGALTITAVCDDRAQARRWVRGQIAWYAKVADYFEPAMRHLGFEREYAEIRSLHARGDITGAIDAVTDEMVEQIALAGTPDEVRSRSGRYGRTVDFLILSGTTFGLSAEEIQANSRAIIETFAQP